MKTILEQIEVMQRYVNGGEVEFYDDSQSVWIETTAPLWNWNFEDYRIKEQKKTITIDKWLVFIETKKEYVIIETSNIKSYDKKLYKPIKLLSNYEVEL